VGRVGVGGLGFTGLSQCHTHYYALQASCEVLVELGAGPRKVLITRRSVEEWERRFERQHANDDSASNAAYARPRRKLRATARLREASLLDVCDRLADHDQLRAY
jgi:hypothetical protein